MNDSSVKPGQSGLISLTMCLRCETWLIVRICKVNAMFSTCNCNHNTKQNRYETFYIRKVNRLWYFAQTLKSLLYTMYARSDVSRGAGCL